MTCIVALRDDDGVIWMAGDSGSFSGWNSSLLPDGKVYRNGEFLLGYTGDGRGADLVRYAFSPPEIGGADVDLMRYMVTRFVDELRSCLKASGFAKTAEGQEKAGGTLLAGVRGHIFTVWSDYCVGEDTRPYEAVGCGAEFAKGAIAAVLKFGSGYLKQQSEGLVRGAIEVAIEHSAGVKGPITVLRSDDR